MAEDFAKKAGIKIEHVPYKGASQGIMDLVGGHIVFSAQTVSSTAALGARRRASRDRAFRQGTRFAGLPGRPTFKEPGYDVVATTWFSISGRPICPRTSPKR